MIDSEFNQPQPNQQEKTPDAEIQQSQALQKAQDYVARGKEARQIGDEATLAEINEQIRKDFAMIELAKGNGVELGATQQDDVTVDKDVQGDQDGWKPMSPEDYARRSQAPTETFYIGRDGRIYKNEEKAQESRGPAKEGQIFSALQQQLHFYDFPQIDASGEELVQLNADLQLVLNEYLQDSEKINKKNEYRKKIDQVIDGHKKTKQQENSFAENENETKKRENVAWAKPWETTSQQWKETLQSIPEFKGNVENTIKLLIQFSAGMEKVWQKINQEQEDQFEPPPLAIYFGENVENVSIQYDPENNVVGKAVISLQIFPKLILKILSASIVIIFVMKLFLLERLEITPA